MTPREFTRPILQSPARKSESDRLCMRTSFPFALPTFRSHGYQSGGRVGSWYHEPSVPHIYKEASVVHRFHRMLLSLGKDSKSVQLCFGCIAMEQIDSVPNCFPVHSLYISDTQGRKLPQPLSGRSFRWHLAFTPKFDCRSGMQFRIRLSQGSTTCYLLIRHAVVVDIFNMLLSHICLAAGERKRGLPFSDSAIAL